METAQPGTTCCPCRLWLKWSPECDKVETRRLGILSRKGEILGGKGAHLEGEIHAATSNLVHVGQGPAIVLAAAGAQLQVLGLLQLKLEKQSHQLSPCRREHVLRKPTEYPDTQRVQVVELRDYVLRDPVTEILKEAEPILDGAP